MRRREVLNGLAGLGLVSSVAACATSANPPTAAWVFVVSVGREISGFRPNSANGSLERVFGPVEAAQEVQACWQARNGLIYVASSDQNTRDRRDRHFLEVLAIGRDFSVRRIGAPLALAARPIDLTVNADSSFVLVAYNRPASVTVHPIGADGGVSSTVTQASTLDFGVYPHQVRMFPSQSAVLVPARGNDASATAAEQPGRLKVFDFVDGQLRDGQTIAPAGGIGFRARHSVFHPSGRRLYLVLEAQNAVQTYDVIGNRLSDTPLHTTTTLQGPTRPGQIASAVLMHPQGHTLYVANRGTGLVDLAGERVAQGENNVAVFHLDRQTGAPILVQNAPIEGVHARTMALSPDAKWLVAATILPAKMMIGARAETRAGGLTLFSVDRDGRLAQRSKLDLDTSGGPVFWIGAAQL